MRTRLREVPMLRRVLEEVTEQPPNLFSLVPIREPKGHCKIREMTHPWGWDQVTS